MTEDGRRVKFAPTPPPPLRSPSVLVVKVGGSAGIDRAAVAADLASLIENGRRVVLVHGASAETDSLGASLGHPSKTIVSPSGQQSRRTDRRTLEIFAMAALGVESFGYVELLKRAGAHPIAVFGALVGTRKDVRIVEDGKTILLRDDFTGRINEIPVTLLWQLTEGGHVPVIPPLAISTQGEGLNIDGDRAAAAIAHALKAETLVILTNVPGLLRSVDDPGSVVPSATIEEAEALAQGRMKKKAMAAREALENGVSRVVIASARVDRPVSRALAGEGTVIGVPVAAP